MEFGVIGIDYKRASLNMRSCASFTDTTKLRIYNDLMDQGIRQSVLLSTCNRSELYFIYETKEQFQGVRDCFLHYSDEALRPHLYARDNREAFVYLLEVCAGYHSMALGEDQILHQMQQAYTFACDAQACAKQMHKIMQRCFAMVRQLKARYRMSEISTSIAALTLHAIRNQMAAAMRIMIIGSGEMARSLLPYLAKENLTHIALCSRKKPADIRDIAGIAITWIAFAKRYEHVSDYDIIISATASPHPVLKKAQYPKRLQKQLLIDLASPKDIEDMHNAMQLPQITLDDLQRQSDSHVEERQRRLQQAHRDVERDALQLYEWLKRSHIEPLLENIQRKSERMAEDTFHILQQKLSLSAHDEHVLHNVLRASFLRMAKEPMQVLKQLNYEQSQWDIVQRVFGSEEKVK